MIRRSVAIQQRSKRSVWLTMCLSLFLLGGQRVASAQIQLSLTGGTGGRGGTVDVTLAMSGDTNNQAVGAGLFVTPDMPTVLSIAPGTDCHIASRLAETHNSAVLPVCGDNCLDWEVATIPPNLNLLHDGDLLTCTYHIAQDAPLGTITLVQDAVLVSDAQSLSLDAQGMEGHIIVAEATPTPTHTEVAATATPTSTDTPLPTATNTPVPSTSTPTNTPVPPTNTPTNTATSLPTATATRTTAAPTATNTVGGGGAAAGGGGGGCNIAASGATADTSMLWLAVPALLLMWRRRRTH